MKFQFVTEEEALAAKEAKERAEKESAAQHEPEESEEKPNEGSKIDVDFETGITSAEVLEREDDIEQATADYIVYLLGCDEMSADDICLESGELASIIDEFEEILAFHGLQIYRPVEYTDDEGVTHIYYSQYADQFE